MAEFIVDDRILKAAGSSATYTTSVEESEHFVERDSLESEDDKLYRIHSENVLCYSCVSSRQLVSNTLPSVI